MPRISQFFGIVIAMYYDDHPEPHLQARYAEHEALFSITTFDVLRGRLPPRATGLVLEWASMHREELVANWDRARKREPLKSIHPLR